MNVSHPASLALDLLWAKTKRDGALTVEVWHPLRAHMWDSAAVAGWLWDNWLPRSVRDLLGNGTESRSLYRWLSGLHDLGKASVAFQTKALDMAATVDAAGLPCDHTPAHASEAPHGLVSGIALVDSFMRKGWPVQEAEWMGLIVGGHHGKFPAVDWLDPQRRPDRQLLGDESWTVAREALFVAVTESLGCRLDRWRGRAIPVPAQLVLTGAAIPDFRAPLSTAVLMTESVRPQERRRWKREDCHWISGTRASSTTSMKGLHSACRPKLSRCTHYCTRGAYIVPTAEVGGNVEDDHYGGIGWHVEHRACGTARRSPHGLHRGDLVRGVVVRVVYGPLPSI